MSHPENIAMAKIHSHPHPIPIPLPSFAACAEVLCINPPFTEAYLADVMARLPELKLRFRLRPAAASMGSVPRKN